MIRNFRVFLVASLSFAALVPGCKTQARIRILPPEAHRYLAHQVDAYEDETAAKLFAEERGRYDKLAKAFRGALSKKNHAKFTHDPRLDAVAFVRAVAWGEEETSTAPGLVKWTLDKLGIAGSLHASPTWWALRGKARTRLTIALKEYAREFDGEGERYSYGVARVDVGTDKWALGLVVVEKAVALHDLPKHYEPGGTFLLRGRVLVPQEGAWFSMQLAGPETLSMRVDVDDDGWFMVKVPVPQTPGRYFVELEVLREPRWMDNVLQLPLYVGVPEPTAPDEIFLNPPPNPPDPAKWAGRLVEIFNNQRRPYGLPPLVVDGSLGRMATAAAHQTTKSCCGRRKSLARRLLEEGIRTDVHSGWAASFEYLGEAFSRKFSQPDFREIILDDRLTKLGFGFARVPEARGKLWNGISYLTAPARAKKLPPPVLAQLAEEVTSYGDPETRARLKPIEPRLAKIAERYEEAISVATGARVVHHPGLDGLALSYGRFGKLEGTLARAMLWKLGIPQGVDLLVRRSRCGKGLSPYTVAEVGAEIASDDEDREGDGSYSFGVSRIPLAHGCWVETLVLVEHGIELSRPIPKSHAPGATITIEGKFAERVKKGGLWFDADRRRVVERKIKVGADGRFSIDIQAPEAAGRHFVEIASTPVKIDAEKKQVNFYHRIGALFPIYVGEPEPSEIDPALLNPPEHQGDVDQWSGRILAVLNEARIGAGLPPFESHELGDALVKDSIYQGGVTFDGPDYKKLSRTLRSNGGGTLYWSASRYVRSPEMVAKWMLLDPHSRSVVLDEEVRSLSAGMNEDGDEYRVLFITPRLLKDPEADRFLSSSLEFEEPARPPIRGWLKENVVRDLAVKHRKKIDKCYRENVPEDEKTRGTIVVDFAVGRTGEVIAASPGASTIDNTLLEDCVIEKFRKWRFPPPGGETAAVSTHAFALSPENREKKKKK